jgi:hypothetical protein
MAHEDVLAGCEWIVCKATGGHIQCLIDADIGSRGLAASGHGVRHRDLAPTERGEVRSIERGRQLRAAYL